jgi:hypothetical protein
MYLKVYLFSKTDKTQHLYCAVFKHYSFAFEYLNNIR